MTDRKIIVVTGCRDWTNEAIVFSTLDEQLRLHKPVIVFHGNCPTGADENADRWCEFWSPRVRCCRFPADWKTHGKAAGPRRNEAMLKAALKEHRDGGDIECLAFWDGESRGTLDCIKQATALGIPVRIVPRGK